MNSDVREDDAFAVKKTPPSGDKQDVVSHLQRSVGEFWLMACNPLSYVPFADVWLKPKD